MAVQGLNGGERGCAWRAVQPQECLEGAQAVQRRSEPYPGAYTGGERVRRGPA